MKAVSAQTQLNYFPLFKLPLDMLAQVATHLFRCRDDIQSFSLTCKKFCSLNLRWPLFFRERTIQNIGLMVLNIPDKAQNLLAEYKEKKPLLHCDGTKFCYEWIKTVASPLWDGNALVTELMKLLGVEDPVGGFNALMQDTNELELMFIGSSCFQDNICEPNDAYQHQLVTRYGYKNMPKLISRFATGEIHDHVMKGFVRYGSDQLFRPHTPLFFKLVSVVNSFTSWDMAIDLQQVQPVQGINLTEDYVQEHPFIKTLLSLSALPDCCIPILIDGLILPLISSENISFSVIKHLLQLIPENYNFYDTENSDDESDYSSLTPSSNDLAQYCLKELEWVPKPDAKESHPDLFIQSATTQIPHLGLRRCVIECLLGNLYGCRDLNIEVIWPFIHQVESHFKIEGRAAITFILRDPEACLKVVKNNIHCAKSLIDLFTECPDFLETVIFEGFQYGSDLKIELYRGIIALLKSHGKRIEARDVITSIPEGMRKEVLRY